MKGKKFYIALIGVLIIGIGSAIFYKQKEETRILEFEGYEISSIQNKVDALYDEEKTDIQENIEDELEELGKIFSELNEKDLSQRSIKQIKNVENEFLSAKEMYELQGDISDLFKEEKIVHKKLSVGDVEKLSSSLVSFEEFSIFYTRNNNLLMDARVQIKNTEKATELVEQLMSDGVPNEDISEEKLDELEKLVGQIKNKSVKKQLMEKIDAYHLAVNELEQEIAMAEAEESEETENEEGLGDENEEDIHEFDQKTDQTDNSSTQSQSQANNQQAQTPNRPAPPSNNQSNTQSNNSSNTSAQKPVISKKYKESKVIEEIPYETIIYENKNIAIGEEIVYQAGSQGSITETYEVIVYSDGTSNKTLISRDKIDPLNRVITVGTKEE